MEPIRQEDVDAGGWSIVKGVLILHSFDSKGRRKDVLKLPLWDRAGQWLVDKDKPIIE